MKVILFYADQNLTAQFRHLKAGKAVTLGNGPKADFGVSGPDIAPLHCSIGFNGEVVVLKLLASGQAPVHVGDEQVTEGRRELRHEDVVRVGHTEVSVAIEHSSPENESTVVAAVPVAPRCVLVSEPQPSGLLRWGDPEQMTDLSELLPRLTAGRTPLLMANYKLAGLGLPEWLSADDDLLAGSPEELVAQHSLHLIGPDDCPCGELSEGVSADEVRALRTGELLAQFHALRKQGAASLLLTGGTRDEVAEALSYRRGFFSTAKGLEMFLKQGSKDLAASLLEGLVGVVVADPGEAEWAVYTSAETALAEDLGLSGKESATEVVVG